MALNRRSPPGESGATATGIRDELAAALGMPHVSFGRATADGYFGRYGYGYAVLIRRPCRSRPQPPAHR